MKVKLYQHSAAWPEQSKIMVRPRINELFLKVWEKPVVLVSAGAGYGKTQAVSSFLGTVKARCIWMNLCYMDNLPSRFWEAFTYSISLLDAEVGEALLQIGFPNSIDDYRRFLRLFSKYLYSGEGVVIVFDDFQMIIESEILNFIDDMVNAKMENLSVFLLSKHREIPFQEWRKDNDFYGIISQEQLMFNLEESQQLLHNYSQQINSRELEQFWRMTEGWPLAMLLLASSNQVLVSNQQVVLRPFLNQLFETEVYNSYSSEVKQLLVKLSLLESFSWEMIERLAGGAINEIEHVLKENMFIHYNFLLKEYVYHNLYRSFLSEKQKRLTKQEFVAVYEMAAEIHERFEFLTDAIQFYRYCGKYEDIWRIIKSEKHDCSIDVAAFYLEVLGEMPKELLAKEPLIKIVEARLLLNNGKIMECNEIIKAIFAGYEEGYLDLLAQQVLGEAYIIDGWLKLIWRDYTYCESYKKALKYLPNGSQFVSAQTLSINACYAIAPRSARKGEVDYQIKINKQILPYCVKVMNGSGYGLDYLVQAEGAYYRNRMDEAILKSHQAISYAIRGNQVDILALAYYTLIRGMFMLGNYEELQKYLQQFEIDVTKEGRAGWIRDIIESWLYSRISRLDLIPAWIKGDEVRQMEVPMNDDGRNHFIRGYCYLEAGRYLELSAYVEYIANYYGKRIANSLPAQIELQLLKAVSAFKLNQQEDAFSSFKAAYQLAYQNELTMFFIEYGNYMRAFINSIRREGETSIPKEWLDGIYSKSVTYAKRLNIIKSRFQQEKNYDNKVEILTERERETLLYLSQGLTREEIAAERQVSINTVKSDLRIIYNKLGAINRKDAVRIASTKNIL